MSKAIVIEMIDGTHRCHQIDADPDVERWAIAFIDIDGAAWVYNAHRFVAFVVTQFVDGEDVDPEPGACQPDNPTSPSTSDRAAGATALSPVEGVGDPPSPSPSPAARPTRAVHRAKHDYAAVAEFARATLAAGRPVQAAIAAHFDVTVPTAGYLLRAARKLGHDIPALPRGGPAKAKRPPRKFIVFVPDPAPEVATAEGDIRGEDLTPIVAVPAKTPPKASEPWQLIPPRPGRPVTSFAELNPLDDPRPPETVGLTYVVIAEAYIEDEEACRLPIGSISDRFGVPRTWANAWVKECRVLGLLPPRDVPQRDRVAPAGAVRHTSAAY